MKWLALAATLGAALVATLGGALGATSGAAVGDASLSTADAWSATGHDAVRGLTIGPIENGYHPGVATAVRLTRALDECRRMGATWSRSRPWSSGEPRGPRRRSDLREALPQNREDVRRAIGMAHERGLSVMLVPHLWVESGDWRARSIRRRRRPGPRGPRATRRTSVSGPRSRVDPRGDALRGRGAALVGDDVARAGVLGAHPAPARRLPWPHHVFGKLGRRRSDADPRRPRRHRDQRVLPLAEKEGASL